MGKQASAAFRVKRESAWRDRLARHAASEQTVVAFCRSEAVSVATYYGWRARLRASGVDAAPTQRTLPAPSPFIDLGPANVRAASIATPGCNDAHLHTPANIEVRIDLGCGVVLTIARR